MTDLRTREKQERIRVIKGAARSSFAQRGFANTTLDDISRECEFSKGTLYNYLGNKETIFQMIVLEGMEDLKKIAGNSLREHAPLATQLQGMSLMLLIYFRKNMDFFRILKRVRDHLTTTSGNQYLETIGHTYSELRILLQSVFGQETNSEQLSIRSTDRTARLYLQLILEYVDMRDEDGNLLTGSFAAGEINTIFFQGLVG
ncbi:MAG: TetR/AcrR family transcriptional regulator [Candidatus Delongbacteria bacterium]|nr:TetR/AcrR family transcriptional regulator [Candidatus Delongbacteria bacterium]